MRLAASRPSRRLARCDVVGDQLAEERPPGGVGGVVAVGAQPVQRRGGVADPAVAARAHQEAGVGAQRVQAGNMRP
jgi:hypothetical protein